jgi:hypothetical protein
MTTGNPTTAPKQWFGIYLGVVTQTRSQDVYVKVQVPTLTGFEIHDWARPMGFTGFAQDGDTGPEAAADLVTTGMPPPQVPPVVVSLSPNKYVSTPGGPPGPGPGPNVGTTVLVMFVAGDLNYPVYALTS